MCIKNPEGILCCGHPDPMTGQPYLQADVETCGFQIAVDSHTVEVASKYGRSVYAPKCRGGYFPYEEHATSTSGILN
jgi:hypothetical protein